MIENKEKGGGKSLKDTPSQLVELHEWGDRNIVKLANHYTNDIEPPIRLTDDLLQHIEGAQLHAWPLVEESLSFLEDELGAVRVSVNREGKFSGDEMVEEVYECIECRKLISSRRTSGFRVNRFVPVVQAAIDHQLSEHHS